MNPAKSKAANAAASNEARLARSKPVKPTEKSILKEFPESGNMHSARFCGKDGLSIEQNAECWLDLARFAPKFKDEATGKGDTHFRLSAKCGQKRLYRHVMRRVKGARSGFIGDVLQKFGGG